MKSTVGFGIVCDPAPPHGWRARAGYNSRWNVSVDVVSVAVGPLEERIAAIKISHLGAFIELYGR